MEMWTLLKFLNQYKKLDALSPYLDYSAATQFLIPQNVVHQSRASPEIELTLGSLFGSGSVVGFQHAAKKVIQLMLPAG